MFGSPFLFISRKQGGRLVEVGLRANIFEASGLEIIAFKIDSLTFWKYNCGAIALCEYISMQSLFLHPFYTEKFWFFFLMTSCINNSWLLLFRTKNEWLNIGHLMFKVLEYNPKQDWSKIELSSQHINLIHALHMGTQKTPNNNHVILPKEALKIIIILSLLSQGPPQDLSKESFFKECSSAQLS